MVKIQCLDTCFPNNQLMTQQLGIRNTHSDNTEMLNNVVKGLGERRWSGEFEWRGGADCYWGQHD